MKNETPRVLAVAGMLVMAAALPLSYRLFHPFVSFADRNTAVFAQAARNMLRYGPVATRLGMAIDAGETAPEHPSFNTHHPSLIAVGAALSMLAFGTSEATARLYPAMCSAGSAVLLFFIWRRHRGDLAGALAALMMISLPGFGHFGKMLGEEAPTLFFSLLALHLHREARDRVTGPMLLTYAAACLSGWAGFYIGPMLIVDGSLSAGLRSRQARRDGLALGLTAIGVFVLVLAQIAILRGSTRPLFEAARYRVTGVAPGLSAMAPGESWTHRVAGYLPRVFGGSAVPGMLLGMLAGVFALPRARGSRRTIATLLILTGLGLAHPLIFRGAAFYHDWLLFHLLPIAGIVMAEGFLLVARTAASLLRWLHGPAAAAGAAAAAVLIAALAHRAVSDARELRRLSDDQPQYASVMLGHAIARMAPAGSSLIANFPMFDPSLRFYADRPSLLAPDRGRYDALADQPIFALYVRDLNMPIEPALAERLERLPNQRVAGFRLYRLHASPGTPQATEPDDPRTIAVRFAPIDAVFGGRLILTGCEVFVPGTPPDPAPLRRRYLGGPGGPAVEGRIVRTISSWRALDPDLPDWSLLAALSKETPDASPATLPLLTLPAMKFPSLRRWHGQETFDVELSFLFPPGYPPGEYTLRLAAYENDRPVPPVLSRTPDGTRKNVVVGRIHLFD